MVDLSSIAGETKGNFDSHLAPTRNDHSWNGIVLRLPIRS